ncbi:stage II sporulation protein P [Clostridium sp. AM34-9AC]|uniref:stage II sporulation protein P n=1 Tax=Clostridia TaxID=186801 RepID=UPI001FAA5D4B|nr:stage II sporulation protein P [Clostridium sp. AM34-9AC]
MKNPKNTVWRIALFLLTVICGLLMADRGENEFPVFACSEALSGESGSTGLLLQQNMWEVVPLLGYGIVEQQGTQNPEEDETTCRTLTTEDLISEELLLPQSEETQQTALIPESVEATAGTALSNFRPAVQQVQIDRTQLADYETLVRNFYAIDANTMAGSDQLSVEKLLGMDMTLPQEGDGPQILIYHTHSQEAFADSVPGDVNTGIVGVGECLTKILTEQYGYRVLHHTGQYDVETRDNAYSRALPAVEQILAENPSIQVIIDLHRDEVAEETKLVTDIQGRPTARFMFFNGLSRTRKTGDIDYLANENQEANLAFSFQMQLKAAEYYPGLTRRIYLKGYRYNMHLRPRTLLVELGAQNNTVEEAINACDPLAHILDMVLKGE